MNRIVKFFKTLNIVWRLGPDRITELEEKAARRQEQAYRDPLTGAYNRRLLEEVGGKEIERARRYKTPFSVIMIDIDDFDKVNNQFGHGKGDEVLQGVTSILNISCRASDIIIRYGGDEFVILLPNTDNPGALATKRRIGEIVESRVRESPYKDFPLAGLSCGVASWSGELSLKSLINKADEEMYCEKTIKRGVPGL